jgi:benzoate membrane transport protein
LRLRELNGAAVAAGLTAFIWYACGALPLQLAVTDALALPSGSVFIVWASGAVASILLSATLRQPIPITWSIPALVYLGSLAGRFDGAQLAGALLVSALILGILVTAGAGARIMKWLPMPIVMGAFAGSLLEYMHRAVTATAADAAIAGTVVAAYLAARRFAPARVPPVGVALLAGIAAIALQGFTPNAVPWALPAMVVPRFAFDPAAIAALAVPLVVFALGLGNAQGLGFLAAQGYRVPVDGVSRAVAVSSLVNALFGGAPATVARNGAALLAAPEAGPASARYWGVIVSSVLVLVMACAAEPFAALIGALPKSFVVSLAGVALVGALQDALARAFGGELRFGALIAFVVAATPISLGGITSAFWALVAGVLASALARERGLLAIGNSGKGGSHGRHPEIAGKG